LIAELDSFQKLTLFMFSFSKLFLYLIQRMHGQQSKASNQKAIARTIDALLR